MRIVRGIVAALLAWGSTICYSGNRFARWFGIWHDRIKTGRGWINLHSIIDICTKTILDYHIIYGYAADISGIWSMMDRLGCLIRGRQLSLPGLGLSVRYLIRLRCNTIARWGRMLRILPKSNTACKSGGSRTRVAWSGRTGTTLKGSW